MERIIKSSETTQSLFKKWLNEMKSASYKSSDNS